MAILAWLFLRGEDSIRIVRDPESTVIRLEGPGFEREVHAFKEEAEAVAFQQNYEARLLADGWVLGASQERRSGRDRRSDTRGPDRRNQHPWPGDRRDGSGDQLTRSGELRTGSGDQRSESE